MQSGGLFGDPVDLLLLVFGFEEIPLLDPSSRAMQNCEYYGSERMFTPHHGQ